MGTMDAGFEWMTREHIVDEWSGAPDARPFGLFLIGASAVVLIRTM